MFPSPDSQIDVAQDGMSTGMHCYTLHQNGHAGERVWLWCGERWPAQRSVDLVVIVVGSGGSRCSNSVAACGGRRDDIILVGSAKGFKESEYTITLDGVLLGEFCEHLSQDGEIEGPVQQ